MTKSSAPAMIEAKGLSKYYGSFAAIEDISFQVREGEVVAFLGPNGAGKSTTMKLLTGYLAASAGKACIAGHDMATDRLAGSARLGYLPENGPLYPDMSPRALLNFFAEARGLTGRRKRERIESVIDLCALHTVIGKPIGKLSRGYRQRVGMAHVLLHEPDVLIMDEPTAGLDLLCFSANLFPNALEQAQGSCSSFRRTLESANGFWHTNNCLEARMGEDAPFGDSR